jgi:Rrf2 family protein
MGQLINVSDAATIGLHAAILIAGRKGKVTATPEIAERLKVSEAHLAKVLQRLSRQGIVKSVRGPKGGFVLARPARDIPLLDIYEAIEGTLQAGNCLFDLPVCRGKTCIFGGLLREFHQKLYAKLAETRLEDVKDVLR